jgi:hypothetical protein
MDTITGITVVFEDHGQDFLEFDIKDGNVIAVRPFQSNTWSGLRVVNESISVGDYIALRLEPGVRTIAYQIIEVRSLPPAVQIGSTDI